MSLTLWGRGGERQGAGGRHDTLKSLPSASDCRRGPIEECRMERTPPSFRHAERFVGELSSRQRDVLCLIANGKTNSEIAEELGITSKNVDDMKANSKNPDARRLLGLEEPSGKVLGVQADWGYQIVKQVGNYGEVFERTVGKGSPLGIERGVNALWNKGGFMYAPPIR